MLIGQTSSSWARRRMLSASRPSASTIPRAASRIRSRDSPLGRVAPSAMCMPYCTAYRSGRGMEGRSTARVLAWMALFGVLAFVAVWVAADARAGVIVPWVAILAAGVLWATRGKAAPSALIPLRPRAFLASSWSGTGEVVLRPVFLGRLLARRFRATREATWISETVWRIDDAADFGGGRVQ